MLATEQRAVCLKQEVIAFVDGIVRANEACDAQVFADGQQPLRFELSYLPDSHVLIFSNVTMDEEFRGLGLAHFLACYAESLPGIKTVGFKNVTSRSLRHFLKQRLYDARTDTDYVRQLGRSRPYVFVDDLPFFLRSLARLTAGGSQTRRVGRFA